MLPVMAIKEIDERSIAGLRDAVQAAGPLTHLGLLHGEFLEFLNALAWFMGGPVDTVDAFLTEVPDPTAQEHRVYWLRGNSIGSLTIEAHQGAQGVDEGHPTKMTGWVRPVSDIKRLDVQEIGFQWSWGEVKGTPEEVRPTVQIHLDGRDIVIGADWPNQPKAARDQAAKFIARLVDAFAR
jgi:hypothetical protein